MALYHVPRSITVNKNVLRVLLNKTILLPNAVAGTEIASQNGVIRHEYRNSEHEKTTTFLVIMGNVKLACRDLHCMMHYKCPLCFVVVARFVSFCLNICLRHRMIEL